MGNYKLSAAAESDLKRIWFRGLDEFGEAQADAYYYRFLERWVVIYQRGSSALVKPRW